ncbi:hypothetical protein GCG54_00015058 [Colletotrichum gloeosporioides]|uniref:Transmembrane protein n=1 Tax=Colletotrichum gloeosporioides TaxID=474922 RepID=A0A8H4CD50_COLGL|nr:uncharacterized protein GCG54_00015058 [Colletotrichum gloeosporioides]KAF3801838.1 hypothetical protein GCG54_00015058 [Colletotrichum gloeosporioides]
MLEIRILLAFFLAFAAVVASQVRDGAPALGTSTSSLLVDAETSRASRQASTEIAHHLQTGEKVAAKSLESDGSRSRHDGKEIMHLWARQNSTPSSQPPLSLSTATLTRTSFIEVPSETQVVVSTLVETVTVVDPIFVTETSTVAIAQAPSDLAKRGFASPVASHHDDSISSANTGLPRDKAPRPDSTSLSSLQDSTPPPAPTTLVTARRGARRQVLDAPVTVVGMISIVTIETTVTLTRTGSFVLTATVVNPIIVSVTATPTSTTTLFVTAGAPTPSSTASNQEMSTIIPEPTIPTTASVRMTISTPVQTSLSPTLPLDETGTSVFTISSSISSSASPTSGITTWFTDDPDGFTWPTVAPTPTPTSTSTQTSASITTSSTVVPDSGSSLRPALDDGQIAGIAVGSIFGIILVALAIWFVRKRSKRRQHVNISEDDYQMTSAATAAAIIDASPPIMNQRDPSGPLPSNTSGESSREGNVRIVIQPAEKRRTQSSGLFPIPKMWPQPPGYNGKTYSFSAGESAESSPREPMTWSNASEYGGSSNREGLPGSGTRGHIAVRNGQGTEDGASGSRF